MSKLVYPLPPPDWPKDKIPQEACWWRHTMTNCDQNGYLYVVTMDGCGHPSCKPPCPDSKWIEWEWFDGLDTIIDGGIDRPTAWKMSLVCIRPIGYLDLLSINRPSPSFYRITEPGDHEHPGISCVSVVDAGSA